MEQLFTYSGGINGLLEPHFETESDQHPAYQFCDALVSFAAKLLESHVFGQASNVCCAAGSAMFHRKLCSLRELFFASKSRIDGVDANGPTSLLLFDLCCYSAILAQSSARPMNAAVEEDMHEVYRGLLAHLAAGSSFNLYAAAGLAFCGPSSWTRPGGSDDTRVWHARLDTVADCLWGLCIADSRAQYMGAGADSHGSNSGSTVHVEPVGSLLAHVLMRKLRFEPLRALELASAAGRGLLHKPKTSRAKVDGAATAFTAAGAAPAPSTATNANNEADGRLISLALAAFPPLTRCRTANDDDDDDDDGDENDEGGQDEGQHGMAGGHRITCTMPQRKLALLLLFCMLDGRLCGPGSSRTAASAGQPGSCYPQGTAGTQRNSSNIGEGMDAAATAAVSLGPLLLGSGLATSVHAADQPQADLRPLDDGVRVSALCDAAAQLQEEYNNTGPAPSLLPAVVHPVRVLHLALPVLTVLVRASAVAAADAAQSSLENESEEHHDDDGSNNIMDAEDEEQAHAKAHSKRLQSEAVQACSMAMAAVRALVHCAQVCAGQGPCIPDAAPGANSDDDDINGDASMDGSAGSSGVFGSSGPKQPDKDAGQALLEDSVEGMCLQALLTLAMHMPKVVLEGHRAGVTGGHGGAAMGPLPVAVDVSRRLLAAAPLAPGRGHVTQATAGDIAGLEPRSLCMHAAQLLLSLCVPSLRLKLCSALLASCPYPNLTSTLLDRVRSDVSAAIAAQRAPGRSVAAAAAVAAAGSKDGASSVQSHNTSGVGPQPVAYNPYLGSPVVRILVDAIASRVHEGLLRPLHVAGQQGSCVPELEKSATYSPQAAAAGPAPADAPSDSEVQRRLMQDCLPHLTAKRDVDMSLMSLLRLLVLVAPSAGRNEADGTTGPPEPGQGRSGSTTAVSHRQIGLFTHVQLCMMRDGYVLPLFRQVTLAQAHMRDLAGVPHLHAHPTPQGPAGSGTTAVAAADVPAARAELGEPVGTTNAATAGNSSPTRGAVPGDADVTAGPAVAGQFLSVTFQYEAALSPVLEALDAAITPL